MTYGKKICGIFIWWSVLGILDTVRVVVTSSRPILPSSNLKKKYKNIFKMIVITSPRGNVKKKNNFIFITILCVTMRVFSWTCVFQLSHLVNSFCWDYGLQPHNPPTHPLTMSLYIYNIAFGRYMNPPPTTHHPLTI